MVGKKKKSVQILVFIVLIIGAIWAGFPVLWMFSNSFKGNAEIFTWPPTWISKNFSRILDKNLSVHHRIVSLKGTVTRRKL